MFWGWLFFGVQDTLTVFTEGQDFAAHYLMESGWGLLFLMLVAVPLIGLVLQPRSPVLIAQIGAVGLAVIVGALLAGSPMHLLPGVGLLLTALGVATLARVDLRPGRLRVDRPLALCVVLAAVPALDYAGRMASRPVDVEKTVNLDHYPIQAALGVAVVLLASLIAVADDRSTARLSIATLVITVGWMGVESVVYPDRLGSFGSTWGWLAVGWALTFLAVALHRPAVRRSDDVAALQAPSRPR